MTHRSRTTALVLAGLLAFAGCGSSDVKDAVKDKPKEDKSSSSSPTPTPTATTSPVAGKGVLTLSDDSGVGGTPYWGLTQAAGWKMVVFDQGGLNQMKNAATGCQLTSYQAKLKDNPSSDIDGSRNLTNNYIAAIRKKAPSVEDRGRKTIVIGRGITKDLSNGIEFYAGAVDYKGTDQVNRRSVIASRAFTKQGNALQLILTCKPEAMASGSSVTALLQQLATVTVE